MTIPCWLMDEIEAFVERWGAARDGRVFYGANGAERAHNDVNHAVQAAGKRIGMDVNAHQLRHTAVSILIDLPVLQRLQRRLGFELPVRQSDMRRDPVY